MSEELEVRSPLGHPAEFAPPRRSRFKLLSAMFLLVAGLAGSVLLFAEQFDSALGTDLSGLATDLRNTLDRQLVQHGLGIAVVTESGLERVPDKKVQDVLGPLGQGSILTYDVAAAKKRLEKLGWIEEAKIVRELPNKLRIFITERRPFAIWQSEGRIFLIDRGGNIIEQNPGAEFAELPLVTGLAANLAAAEILDSLGRHTDIAAQTKAAIRIAARRWNLRLDNGLVIKLPARGVGAALAELAQLEAGFRILHRDLEAIDLRLPGRVTLRMTEDAAVRRNFLLNSTRTGKDGGRRI